jgi:hypothetical protein
VQLHPKTVVPSLFIILNFYTVLSQAFCQLLVTCFVFHFGALLPSHAAAAAAAAAAALEIKI